jgi:hypothetical protein
MKNETLRIGASRFFMGLSILFALASTLAFFAKDADANSISSLPSPQADLHLDGYEELVAGHWHDLLSGHHSSRGHGTSPTGGGNPHGMPDAPDQCGNCQGNSGNGIGNGGGETPPAVPEPGTFVMLFAGLLGLAVMGSRYR